MRLHVPLRGWSDAAREALAVSGVEEENEGKREGGENHENHENHETARQERKTVFEGELLQMYAVVTDPPAWLRQNHFFATVHVSDSQGAKNQSALLHFSSDAHSSPTEKAALPPRAEVVALTDAVAVVKLSAIVTVSNAHASPLLLLRAVVEPARAEMAEPARGAAALRSFLVRQAVRPPLLAPLEARHRVRLVQPLAVTVTDAACGSKVFLSLGVENRLADLDVTVDDVEVHLNRTRYYVLGRRSELATAPLDRYFRVFSDRGALPLRLRPRERHSFVVVIEPAGCNPADLAHISHNLLTLITVRWSCAQVAAPVLLQVKAAWSRPVRRDLTVSMRFASPVPVNRAFPVSLTVSNHSARGEDALGLAVVVLPAAHPLVLAQQQRQQARRNAAGFGDWQLVETGVAPAFAPDADAGAAAAADHAGDQYRRLAAAAIPRGDIVGVESSVALGDVPAGCTGSATVHFMALREGLLELSGVFLSRDHGRSFLALERVPTVFAVPETSIER